MGRYRKLSLILLAALLIGALVIVGFERGLFERYLSAPLKSSLTVEIDESFLPSHPKDTDSVYEQHVRIAGTTSIPSRVKLLLNENTIGPVDTDSSNRFDFSYVTLRPGVNKLRVIGESVVGWRELESYDYLRLHYEPVRPSVPVLFPSASIVNSPRLTIRGAADPAINAVVKVEKLQPASGPGSVMNPNPPTAPMTQEYPRTTDNEGRFDVEIQLPEEGVYKIFTLAKNSKDQTSDSSNILEVKYDKGFYPNLELRNRSTSISIGYREVRTEMEATLPSGDPMAIDLITGKLTPIEFVINVFGVLTINDAFAFADLTPETKPLITFGEGRTTIRFTSNVESEYAGMLPSFSGPLKIERFSAWEGPDDTLKLSVRDYGLRYVSPLPSTLSGDEAVWVGDKAEQAFQDGIKAELSSDPSVNPLRLLQLTPLVFLPRLASQIFGVFQDALSVIPMLWFIWLLQEKRVPLEASQISTLQKTTNRLVVWACLPIIYGAVMSNWGGSLIDSLDLEFLIPDFLNVAMWVGYFASLLLVIAAIALLFLTACWFRRFCAAFWVMVLMKAFFKAWLAVTVFIIFLYFLGQLEFHYFELLTTAIVAPLLLLFFRDVGKGIKAIRSGRDTTSGIKLGTGEWLMLLFFPCYSPIRAKTPSWRFSIRLRGKRFNPRW